MLKIIRLSIIMALSVVTVGCGNNADESASIINNLESGNGYAYVDVNGLDEPLLLVADSTYEYEGTNAAMWAYPYLPDQNGHYTKGDAIQTDSTGTPIRINDEGELVCMRHKCADYYVIAEYNGVQQLVSRVHYEDVIPRKLLDEYDEATIIDFTIID